MLMLASVTFVEARTHAQVNLTPGQSKIKHTSVPAPRLVDSETMEQSDVEVKPSILFTPLVFGHQTPQPDVRMENAASGQEAQRLNGDNRWIDDALSQREQAAGTRYRATVNYPQLVAYNASTLPEPPTEHVVTPNPAKNRLSIETVPDDTISVDPILELQEIKVRNWLHAVNASLHFTQAYISQNWYQGGENNINILGLFQWDCNLNQKIHPNYLFENMLQYKIGVMSAHNDTLRNYAINEDNFLFTSKFGYKAIKNWYYSASLMFKTQLFNAYKSNTNDLTASFLSPAELNIGLGMTYNYKDKDGFKVLSLSIAPLSYNMKICRDIIKLDPTKFGIDAGHHTKHSFGSNLECKFSWKIRANINWDSRLYVFTNYHYAQGDWENTLDFSVTRHLNTKIFTHLRYDKSRPRHEEWKYWQFKEILSFGLTYKFSIE